MSGPSHPAIPRFEIQPPKGYHWLIDRELVGFEPFTRLQPWHYLDAEAVFDVSQRWPNGPSPDRLIAFAKRQDRDDLACFQVQGDAIGAIIVIHGWTSEGYAIIASYDNFWTWLKSVVDDIAEWSEPA